MGTTVHKYLDLSTGHLDRATAMAMDEPYDGLPTRLVVIPVTRDDEFGWLVPTCGFDDEADWPQCMKDCVALARKLGCDYIRFDRDADATDELPFYDW